MKQYNVAWLSNDGVFKLDRSDATSVGGFLMAVVRFIVSPLGIVLRDFL